MAVNTHLSKGKLDETLEDPSKTAKQDDAVVETEPENKACSVVILRVAEGKDETIEVHRYRVVYDHSSRSLLSSFRLLCSNAQIFWMKMTLTVKRRRKKKRTNRRNRNRKKGRKRERRKTL
jgi:hypothetical protein